MGIDIYVEDSNILFIIITTIIISRLKAYKTP